MLTSSILTIFHLSNLKMSEKYNSYNLPIVIPRVCHTSYKSRKQHCLFKFNCDRLFSKYAFLFTYFFSYNLDSKQI